MDRTAKRPLIVAYRSVNATLSALIGVPVLVCYIILVSGCGLPDWAHNGWKVGPEYCRPGASVADYWIEAGDERLVESMPSDPQWWSTLNDPVLDSMIQAAYGQNLSLREALWRVMQARAARDIAVGNIFPQSQQACTFREKPEAGIH